MEIILENIGIKKFSKEELTMDSLRDFMYGYYSAERPERIDSSRQKEFLVYTSNLGIHWIDEAIKASISDSGFSIKAESAPEFKVNPEGAFVRLNISFFGTLTFQSSDELELSNKFAIFVFSEVKS